MSEKKILKAHAAEIVSHFFDKLKEEFSVAKVKGELKEMNLAEEQNEKGRALSWI